MDESTSFGYWVRRRRKALDLTQEALARAVGCALITMKKIEADERRPSVQMAERLADSLAIPIGERKRFLACARGLISPLNLAISTQPLEQSSRPHHNLPAAMTSFIGRESMVETVIGLLRATAVRLVTLIGAGGVGKTRLALEAAGRLLLEFRDGVYFIDLGSAQPPQGLQSERSLTVMRAIAQILELKEAVDDKLADDLRTYLREKQILLLLDNFEHLADTAILVSDLLAAAPRVKALVTSREALGLRGEHEVLILPLPDEAALRLFVERARAVQVDFALTATNTQLAVEICRRLDGLPLAIELAAPQIKLWSLTELLDKMEARLPLLVGGRWDAPERQQTLLKTLDWSYELLGEAEKRLFRRLGVFAGGFTVGAVDQICSLPSEKAGQDPEQQFAPVAQTLAALVGKSLVYRKAIGEETRLYLLESIREYALKLLGSSQEAEAIQQHHLAYYTKRMETEEDLRFRAQGLESAWLERVGCEYDNALAALAWAFEGHDPRCGARLASAMKTYWYMQGRLIEGRAWLERALSFMDTRDSLRAAVLAGIGCMAWQQGDYVLARAKLEEGKSILREAGQAEGRDMAFVLHILGHVRFDQKAYAEAGGLFSESLETYQQIGDAVEVMALTGDLGLVAYHRRDYGEALRRFEAGLAQARAQGSEDGIAVHLVRLGDLARIENDLNRAEKLYAESLALCRKINDVLDIASSLHKLGQVYRQRGEIERARSLFLESLALQESLGNRQGIVECLGGLAGALLHGGKPEDAARLFGVGESLLDQLAAPLAPADQLVWDADRAALFSIADGGKIEAAWRQGMVECWEAIVRHL